MRTILKSYKSIYKVFFEGSSLINKENLDLTFFGDPEETVELSEFQTFLVQLDKKDPNKNIKSIKNIKEILPLGTADKKNLSRFVVILVNKNSDETSDVTDSRFGFLIAYNNKLGYILLGVWPFKENSLLTSEISPKTLFSENLKQNNKYSEILIIS